MAGTANRRTPAVVYASHPEETQRSGPPERPPRRRRLAPKIRSVGEELAAFQSFEELGVYLDAGNAALSVGRRHAIISGVDRRYSDENRLARETRGQLRLS